MAMNSVWCPVLEARVRLDTDLEGAVARIICAEYGVGGTCRLKKSALNDGPLGQLLGRISRHDLSTRSPWCLFHPA